MRFMGCDLRSGFGRARRAIPIGLGVLGILLSAVHAEAATAAPAGSGFRSVAYRGYSFQVPRSWRVIKLAHHRRTCVRFNRHVAYLGTPPPNQACPSQAFGTTEAMLIEPASGHAPRTSSWNPVTRQVTVTADRIRITATFDTHRGQIGRILASAGLPRPVKDPPKDDPAKAEPVPLSAGVTNYHGRGFDACTAPSEAVMHTWWVDSPFGAIGIYLGGSDAACSQPNLTPAWLRDEAAQGWHYIPLYVGPQAAFGELRKNSSASQGVAAATDAAHRAQQLGFGPMTPIYYDMEGYARNQATRVLRFLSAWTTTLHALGYSSGAYSSSSSGIADLAGQYGGGVYTMPDVIYDALWNGHANTSDPVFSPGQWANHHRLHQYNGNITRTYGGIQINIDLDYMDVHLAAVQHTYQTVVKGLRVHNAPSTSAATVGAIGATGSRVTVDCYAVGTAVFGDHAWYHLVAPLTGYVAGYYLNTGVDPAAGVPLC
jgi:Domain of unknown function (DUF1906)